MALNSVASSSQGSLSPQQEKLVLANLDLESASKTNDRDEALKLCDKAEANLSKAYKAAKRFDDQNTIQGIAIAYDARGKVLEDHQYVKKAQASYKKAKNLKAVEPIKGVFRPKAGSQNVGPATASPLNQHKQSNDIVTVAAHIFAEDVRPLANNFQLPEKDERLKNTPQLVCCLGLLRNTYSADDNLEPAVQQWLQAVKKDTDEQERLRTMASHVLGEYDNGSKDAKAIAEVVCLAPVLDKDEFHKLLSELHSGIEHSGLLDIHRLEGLAKLIQGADPDHLSADDLVKILELLSNRLMNTHQQSSPQMHQLTFAVSHVLDAMADTKVTGLDRKKLHAPLSSYLDELRRSPDPFLVYQSAYAFQALLCVPDDETTWRAAMRRTGKVIQGISGLVSAVKGLDLTKFIAGLEDIHEGFKGAPEVIRDAFSIYDRLTSLAAKGLEKSITEGLSFNRKRDWYSALRGADILIQDGELATFKKLICEAPCRKDPTFQWGVCQRLGEIALHPMWDEMTRQSAIEFLGEIYKNDKTWGQHLSIKHYILNILNILTQLSSPTGVLSRFAESLIQEQETTEDAEAKAIYQAWKEDGPTSYPLRTSSQELACTSLLDRVQSKPDIERDLRRLKGKCRRSNAIYISPQAKSSRQASDGTCFPLMKEVNEFLKSDRKVFLLLGDSGTGKSTFFHELEFDLWKSYKTKTGRIPLYISLPKIDKPEHDLITKQLRKAKFSESQIQEMKHHRKFILICDGYDECSLTHNLYMSNELDQPEEWDALMVISCRSDYLGLDYRNQFQPVDRNQGFQEAVLTPFSLNQVHDYIKQYVSIHQPQWSVDEYKHVLDVTPGLKDLVTNPFMMTVSLDVLPRMMDPGQQPSDTRITRVALYDHFVQQWLERGKKRLGEEEMSSQRKEAFGELNAEGFVWNGIEYLKKFAEAIYKEQDGHPVVVYSKLRAGGSWKDDLFRGEENQLLRKACLLKREGTQYQFIHQSLLEYALARAVFDHALARAVSDPKDTSQEPNPSSPLVWRNFVKNHSLLKFLEERVQQGREFRKQQGSVFEKQLFAYIEHSKRDKKWSTAAANAITILIRAGVRFNGKDFRGIRIPEADLSYGTFDSVQLQGADMREVNLRGAWLRQSNLSKADMTGIQFGELPNFANGSYLASCAYSPDGKSFAVGFFSGVITVRSTTTWLTTQTLKGHGEPIDKIVFSREGGRIASSCYKTIWLWDLNSEKCLRTLSEHAEEVTCFAYSRQGDQFASSDGRTLRLWDPATGECRWTLSGHDMGIQCLAFSSKGHQIASGGEDSSVRLWNVETGECSHIFMGHTQRVLDIAFSPREDKVASSSADKTIRLWDTQTGGISRSFVGHAGVVYNIAFSEKGDQIASGSWDATAI
ncbi:hypothetical protein BGX34_004455 [Mortierella sp. NVP85]|nr:hypothetical protein BGX34_004455 [Mortierella sp. NVP85]